MPTFRSLSFVFIVLLMFAGAPFASAQATDSSATGTGFFISRDGYLVTNFHVIEGRDNLTVLWNGEVVLAELVASDPNNDIAVLRIARTTVPLTLGSSRDIRVGQEVFSMGYPLASIQGNELRANFGRVNALSGAGGDSRFLQVDVPVQPGSSGGPLIGANGAVIGIITARLDDLAVLQATGSLPENIGFAIKIDYVLPLLPTGVRLVPEAQLTGTIERRIEAGRQSVVLVVASSLSPGSASATSSISGFLWSADIRWQRDATTKALVAFNVDGTVSTDGGVDGRWTMDGNTVVIQFSSGSHYTGTVSQGGRRISGTAQHPDGDAASWEMVPAQQQ
ncbi:MAG: hypothetical protein DCF16_07560 [Alphaproteobacteria bacterium]|nr:MAG: hypothetical protein DCF16_07560 [Alphaproteobacteria bacterium]